MPEGRRRWESQLKQRENYSTFLFCLDPLRIEWCPPTLGRIFCFTQFTKCWFFLEALSHTNPEIICYQVARHRWAQSSRHNKINHHAYAVLVVKNPPANAGDVRDAGPIPGLGRSPGEEHGNLLQYSCLENSVDRGAWWATVHGVTKNQTWLKQLSRHTWTSLGHYTRSFSWVGGEMANL